MPRPVLPPTCAACGYDLTGLPVRGSELRCPECGGTRVRMARWYEPGLSRGRALLYLPAAALASCPGLAVGWLIVTATGAPAQVWAVLGPAPYACLGVLLALWRPGGPAGVTVLGLGSVVAFLLGMLLTLSSHIPALAVMLGGCYCVAPPVLGVLWAYAVLREG